jgi:hypothetical protein
MSFRRSPYSLKGYAGIPYRHFIIGMKRGVAQWMLITETTTTLPLEGTGKRLPEGVKKISSG